MQLKNLQCLTSSITILQTNIERKEKICGRLKAKKKIKCTTTKLLRKCIIQTGHYTFQKNWTLK